MRSKVLAVIHFQLVPFLSSDVEFSQVYFSLHWSLICSLKKKKVWAVQPYVYIIAPNVRILIDFPIFGVRRRLYHIPWRHKNKNIQNMFQIKWGGRRKSAWLRKDVGFINKGKYWPRTNGKPNVLPAVCSSQSPLHVTLPPAPAPPTAYASLLKRNLSGLSWIDEFGFT